MSGFLNRLKKENKARQEQEANELEIKELITDIMSINNNSISDDFILELKELVNKYKKEEVEANH